MIKLTEENVLKKLEIKILQSSSEIEDFISKNYVNKTELDDNLKFIKLYKNLIQRDLDLLKLINPKGEIYEIGPGACYFLYLCRNINGCKINGIDLESPIFRIVRKNLNIDNINETRVTAFRKIPFVGQYDFIVTFLTMFNSGWGKDAHKFWLSDCANHLNEKGKIIIHFNKRTFHKEIQSIYYDIGKEISNLMFLINKEQIQNVSLET